MKISIVKSFSARHDLDDYIRGKFGEDANLNKDITFESTPENLQELQLSESSTVWGVKVKALPSEKTEPVIEPVEEAPLLGAVKKKKR